MASNSIKIELNFKYGDKALSFRINTAKKCDSKKKSEEAISPKRRTSVQAERKSSFILFASFSDAKKRMMLDPKESWTNGTIIEMAVIINDHAPYCEDPRAFVNIGSCMMPRTSTLAPYAIP